MCRVERDVVRAQFDTEEKGLDDGAEDADQNGSETSSKGGLCPGPRKSGVAKNRLGTAK